MAGWVAHYCTGAVLALTYPLVSGWAGADLPLAVVLVGLLWGVATALLPWLVMFPGYGWGAFGVRAPRNVRPLLSLTVEHATYGLGVAIVVAMAT